jgi:hypothetical protein
MALRQLINGSSRGHHAAQPRAGMCAPLQRVIDDDNPEYVGRRVTHEKYGGGTIVGIKDGKYRVQFADVVGRKRLFGASLTLAGEHTADDVAEAAHVEAPAPEPLRSAADAASVSSSSDMPAPSSPVPAAAASSATAAPAAAPYVAPVPTQMVLAKVKAKIWSITLRDASDTPIVSMEKSDAFVKPLIGGKNRMTDESHSQPAARTYSLAAKPLHPELKKVYDDAIIKQRLERQFEDFRKARQPSQSPGKLPTQVALMDRLDVFKTAAPPLEKSVAGHDAIRMIAIELLNEITLDVGGEARKITHLYIQVGNSADGTILEWRCYLGDKRGAYQRVHTSLTRELPSQLTQGQPSRAHTMVQTSDTIAIPGIRERGIGTRVGFDSIEGNQPGFATRKLTDRGAKGSDVSGSLKGQDISSLAPEIRQGCQLLADRFNDALDRASADVQEGDAQARRPRRTTAAFTVLDDEWLFKGGRAATPDEEWRHSKNAEARTEKPTRRGIGKEEAQSAADTALRPPTAAARAERHSIPRAESPLPEILHSRAPEDDQASGALTAETTTDEPMTQTGVRDQL